MTEENVIQPERYEVIRLITNAEFVCMTIDKEDHVLALLPMKCFITENLDDLSDVRFQPYCALTNDINIVVKKEHIIHRSDLHSQFIPLYDSASSLWMEMVEENKIPIKEMVTGFEPDDNFEEDLEEYLEENFEPKPTDPKKLH
jgi:hypothetical protein